MNKPDRGALLRARFAAKCGASRWVASGKVRRIAEAPRKGHGITNSAFSYANSTPAKAPEWVYMPNPAKRVTVETKQPGQEESALTKAAKAMYEFNRMDWRPEAAQP